MLTVTTAIRIWQILLEEAGITPNELTKMSFVLKQSKEHCSQWDFGGSRFAGKFCRQTCWYVTGPEHSKPLIERINARLAALKEECPNEI